MGCGSQTVTTTGLHFWITDYTASTVLAGMTCGTSSWSSTTSLVCVGSVDSAGGSYMHATIGSVLATASAMFSFDGATHAHGAWCAYGGLIGSGIADDHGGALYDAAFFCCACATLRAFSSFFAAPVLSSHTLEARNVVKTASLSVTVTGLSFGSVDSTVTVSFKHAAV